MPAKLARATLHSRTSDRGQVTLPVAIRRLLGVRPHELVAFEIEGEQVRLRRSDGVIARTAGVFKGCGPTVTAEQFRVAAEIAIAEDVAERAGH